MILEPVSTRDERDLHLNLLISSPGEIIPDILGIRSLWFYFSLDTSRYKLRILTRIPASPYIFLLVVAKPAVFMRNTHCRVLQLAR